MGYDWNFSFLLDSTYIRALASGLGLTIVITLFSIVLGTFLGIALGVVTCIGGPRSPSPSRLVGDPSGRTTLKLTALTIVRGVAIAGIDIVRAVPLLLLILFFYYALPVFMQRSPVQSLATFMGLDGVEHVNPVYSCVIALAVNLSAFVADLVRGATAGVPRGSIFAAQSLGMTNRQIWKRIILPEVGREILPPMTLLYITILKMSTLCSVCAVYELLHSADAIISKTYRPLEMYTVVCAVFVAIILPLSAFARWLEGTRLFRRELS